MVPQSCQKEKVNRLKLKIFLIGHIYEVKIISINKLQTLTHTKKKVVGKVCRFGPLAVGQ